MGACWWLVAVRVDTSGVDTRLLLGKLNRTFGLALNGLRFLPKGEEAYHYVATDGTGVKHFVKLQGTDRVPHFERGLEVAAALHDTHGLRQVVAPRRTRDGDVSVGVGSYRAAIFPFYAGASGHEQRFSEDELGEAVRLVATMYACTGAMTAPTLPRVMFEDEFSAPILRSLAHAAGLGPTGRRFKAQVRNLLLAEQAGVLAELETVRRLAEAARAAMTRPVLTHGDPNDANLVRGDDGRIRLVDWSDPALGPRERDLSAFVEDRFEQALRCYRTVAGPVLLRVSTFAYYAHRWVVQEIADYTTRILFTNTDPAEDESAWESLTPYLPVPQATIAKTIADIDAVLHLPAPVDTPLTEECHNEGGGQEQIRYDARDDRRRML